MGGNGDPRLRFGNYELDSRSGKLLCDGQPVKIQPQPLRVLAVLAEHPGEIVSREQLRERIWGDATFVEFDQGLNYCIRQIRVALGDDALEPAYIETLPKQGYRFIAPTGANGQTVDSVFRPAESEADPGPPTSPVSPVPPTSSKRPHWKILGTAMLVLALSAAGIAISVMRQPAANQPLKYTQITSFTDAAVGPALSPDGRMVAFFRSDRSFFTADQIYVKMLPDGEPVQLTHDPRLKYNLSFSPDGSRIAYTVVNPRAQHGWDTFTVSTLGGDSKLFLPDASGLSWLDQHRLLFSEIKTGIHMGIVTEREDRSEHREIYFPAEQRRMAHYSYPSPDRKWILVAEMNPQWQQCRLIPFSGASAGTQVGPPGACMSAAWSPDGDWMYFGVAIGGKRHLWRERFPDGHSVRLRSAIGPVTSRRSPFGPPVFPTLPRQFQTPAMATGMNRGSSTSRLASLQRARAFFSPSTMAIGICTFASCSGLTPGGMYSRFALPGAPRYFAFGLTFPSFSVQSGLSRRIR